MQYIGNFKSWLQPYILDIILTTPGDRRPETKVEYYKQSLSDKWTSAGYKTDKIGWSLYYQEHFDTKIILPDYFQGTSNWWFCKLNPGDVFPLHQDLFKNTEKIKRFWMACQDCHPGHIFFYKDKTLNDYKAGDLFLFDNQDEWHGSCNIGFIPKISLQIVCNQ